MQAGGYLDASEEWGGAAASQWQPARAGDAPPPLHQGPAHVPGGATSPTPARSERRHGQGHVCGVARAVQVRALHEQREEVLTFRVERYDQSGNRLAPVGVELRGYRGGHLGDGEEVEVTGRWSKGTLLASRIANLSTGADLGGRSRGSSIALGVGYALVVGFILVIFVSIAYSILIG